MRRKGRIVAAVFVALGLSVSVLEATIVEISLTAEITYIRDADQFDGQLQIGDIITGSYKYESTMPGSNPLLSVGDYEHYSPPYGISLTAGGFVFQTDPDNVDFLVEVVNNHYASPTQDDYGIISYNNLPLSNGVLVAHISWHLGDTSGTALSSDTLPTTAPVLDDWSYSWGIDIHTGPKVGHVAIGADVISVELVPEPTTLFLLGLGSLLVLRYERGAQS